MLDIDQTIRERHSGKDGSRKSKRKNGFREKEVELTEEGTKFAERLKAGSGLELEKISDNKQGGRNDKGNDE